MKNAIGTLIYWVSFPLIFVSMRGSRRSRVLLVCDKEILLVKDFIDASDKWSLPGGGVKGSETARECAVRELKEETGMVIDSRKLRELGEVERKSRYFTYTACLFAVNIERKRSIKTSVELLEAKWFHISKLPKNRKALVDQAISRLKQG